MASESLAKDQLNDIRNALDDDSPTTFLELEDEDVSAFLAQKADDNGIDIEAGETEAEWEKRRERVNKGLITTITETEGSFERLRSDPNCMELPKGIPLGVIVPGAEIVGLDEDS